MTSAGTSGMPSTITPPTCGARAIGFAMEKLSIIAMSTTATLGARVQACLMTSSAEEATPTSAIPETPRNTLCSASR
jgi:hypothetical protein